jgi:hypothetical protein
MVRFSDLLGRGGDDEPRDERPDDAAPGATPTEPVPPAPTEPPPPPPPGGSGNSLLDSFANYTGAAPAPPPPPPPAEPPASAHDEPIHALIADDTQPAPYSQEAFVESLTPVDDDLLPARRKK